MLTRAQIGDKGGAVEAERSEAKRTHTDDVVLVYVDHPFLMMIRSNPTPQKFTIAQILAIGKYALPNGRIVFGRDELWKDDDGGVVAFVGRSWSGREFSSCINSFVKLNAVLSKSKQHFDLELSSSRCGFRSEIQ